MNKINEINIDIIIRIQILIINILIFIEKIKYFYYIFRNLLDNNNFGYIIEDQENKDVVYDKNNYSEYIKEDILQKYQEKFDSETTDDIIYKNILTNNIEKYINDTFDIYKKTINDIILKHIKINAENVEKVKKSYLKKSKKNVQELYDKKATEVEQLEYYNKIKPILDTLNAEEIKLKKQLEEKQLEENQLDKEEKKFLKKKHKQEEEEEEEDEEEKKKEKKEEKTKKINSHIDNVFKKISRESKILSDRSKTLFTQSDPLLSLLTTDLSAIKDRINSFTNVHLLQKYITNDYNIIQNNTTLDDLNKIFNFKDSSVSIDISINNLLQTNNISTTTKTNNMLKKITYTIQKSMKQVLKNCTKDISMNSLFADYARIKKSFDKINNVEKINKINKINNKEINNLLSKLDNNYNNFLDNSDNFLKVQEFLYIINFINENYINNMNFEDRKYIEYLNKEEINKEEIKKIDTEIITEIITEIKKDVLSNIHYKIPDELVKQIKKKIEIEKIQITRKIAQIRKIHKIMSQQKALDQIKIAIIEIETIKTIEKMPTIIKIIQKLKPTQKEKIKSLINESINLIEIMNMHSSIANKTMIINQEIRDCKNYLINISHIYKDKKDNPLDSIPYSIPSIKYYNIDESDIKKYKEEKNKIKADNIKKLEKQINEDNNNLQHNYDRIISNNKILNNLNYKDLIINNIKLIDNINIDKLTQIDKKIKHRQYKDIQINNELNTDISYKKFFLERLKLIYYHIIDDYIVINDLYNYYIDMNKLKFEIQNEIESKNKLKLKIPNVIESKKAKLKKKAEIKRLSKVILVIVSQKYFMMFNSELKPNQKNPLNDCISNIFINSRVKTVSYLELYIFIFINIFWADEK